MEFLNVRIFFDDVHMSYMFALFQVLICSWFLEWIVNIGITPNINIVHIKVLQTLNLWCICISLQFPLNYPCQFMVWTYPVNIPAVDWSRPEAIYFLTELTMGAEGEPYQQQVDQPWRTPSTAVEILKFCKWHPSFLVVFLFGQGYYYFSGWYRYGIDGANWQTN